MICCAHSVLSSVTEHRHGAVADAPQARGGSRCISCWGNGEDPKLIFLSVRRQHSSIVGLGRWPRLSQAGSCLPRLANCPASGTECLLYTALCKYTDWLDLPWHVGRGPRSVAGPNLVPATAKAISISTEKHGSHGSRVSTRAPGASGGTHKTRHFGSMHCPLYGEGGHWGLAHPHQTEAIQNPLCPWGSLALGGG